MRTGNIWKRLYSFLAPLSSLLTPLAPTRPPKVSPWVIVDAVSCEHNYEECVLLHFNVQHPFIERESGQQ